MISGRSRRWPATPMPMGGTATQVSRRVARKAHCTEATARAAVNDLEADGFILTRGETPPSIAPTSTG